MLVRLLLLLLVLVAFGSSGVALASQRTDKHAEYGFSLEVPTSFEARPVPAEMPGLLAVYAPKDAPKDRRSPVTHALWRITLGSGGRSTADLAVRRWMLDVLQPTRMESVRSVRRRYGRDPIRYEGATLNPEGEEESLFVHAWVGDEDVIVFVGQCETGLLRRESRAFDRTAMSFRFFSEAETEASRQKWTRHYLRTSLPHRDERIEIASAAVDGWSIRDTEHSMILFHGPSDSPVLAQIAKNLVAVRRRFAEDFPPDRPIDALSVVRVCRDRGEYLTYGGNPNTVGYFHPRVQELVLYDARTDASDPMPDDHPTMRTLYHEACHQFLHHTASSMSPHSWYDEGSSEFYAGAVFQSGAVCDIEGLADREAFLRQREVRPRLPKLEALLSMTQEQFYADANVNYSMGYALIRFLRTAEAARIRPEWRSLPKRYFETLRTRWRREAESLALSGLSGAGYEQAVNRSRGAALDAALENVDLEELEAEFLEWLRQGGSNHQ
ncbi:hypothetical protein Poly30_34720 [Planctomycetes bacterium Poly30]|uniref:DUF1570 domain-containing protein n=2 Tax=Saltatorellus ferox TaxID=2528018 RepID=A0A518EV10_9BACT|nr:hypothetical protein Poly30_34720 [Planctomycetes bacterium Poly30]